MAADNENVYAPISDIIPGPGGGIYAQKIATGEQVGTTLRSPRLRRQRGCAGAGRSGLGDSRVVFSGSMDGICAPIPRKTAR